MLRENYVARKTSKRIIAIFETFILTILGIFLGFWFTPNLAFFAAPGFSWLLVGPFFSGLRYGFAYALNSTFFLIILMWLVHKFYYPDWGSEVFLSTGLAVFCISIIAGEFRNYSQRKIDKLQASFNYVDERLGEVSNAFNMLKISHERLAQQAASRSTLRDSLLVARSHIMRAKSAESTLASLSALILRIFADYGSIQQAAIYTLNKHGKLNPTADVFFGGEFEVDPEDLLLKQVLTSFKTTTLKPELVTKEEYSDLLLLAIPIVDVVGEVWGIVLVNKMPFRAFRSDNIRLLAILAGHIADLISMTKFDSYSVKDTDLQYFILQVKRCMNDANIFALEGSIVMVEIKNIKISEEVVHLIMSGQRGLDNAWATKNKSGIQCVFILLPLTDFIGVEGYKMRLQNMLKDNYEYKNLEEADIILHKSHLTTKKTLQEFMGSLFEELDIDKTILTHQDYGQR